MLNQYKRGDFEKPVNTIRPVPGAADFIRDCLKRGDKLFISSCRADSDAGVGDIKSYLTYILGLGYHEVSSIKISDHKPKADVYIDDHGARFEGKFPTREELKSLAKTWLEK